MDVLNNKEHDPIDDFREKLESVGINPFDLKLDPEDPNRYLGLSYDYVRQQFFANYYIGACWINKEKDIKLAVLPKVKLDYARMFMSCWDDTDADIQSKLADIYHIDLDAPLINVPGMDVEIMPLIILHFAKLMEQLLKHSLKSDYVTREENLQSKIKGKLMFVQHLKRNVLLQHLDRNYCRYQEYSIDCLENRILKKALTFSRRFLEGHKFSNHEKVMSLLTKELEAFTNVSEDVPVAQLKSFRVNPLYREYLQALKVAKIILQRFSYDIRKVDYDNKDHLMPPFWINMPLLFELYVLQLLKRKYGDVIAYHITSRGNEIDYGKRDEKIIIDAKYIPAWSTSVDHDNVRQLSGYARNISIRYKLIGQIDTTTILPCIIIYPDIDNGLLYLPDNPVLNNLSGKEVPSYLNFYRLGVKLPKK